MIKTINCSGATLVYGFHSVRRVCTLVLFILQVYQPLCKRYAMLESSISSWRNFVLYKIKITYNESLFFAHDNNIIQVLFCLHLLSWLRSSLSWLCFSSALLRLRKSCLETPQTCLSSLQLLRIPSPSTIHSISVQGIFLRVILMAHHPPSWFPLQSGAIRNHYNLRPNKYFRGVT